MVYSWEAHAEDAWKFQGNIDAGIHIPEPKTFEERLAAAANYRTRVILDMPLLADGIDNAVEGKYISHPLRLYVVDGAGDMRWIGGLGSRKFDPDQWEAELIAAM